MTSLILWRFIDFLISEFSMKQMDKSFQEMSRLRSQNVEAIIQLQKERNKPKKGINLKIKSNACQLTYDPILITF